MGGDQMMLSNSHRELPSWSVSFCVGWGRNFCLIMTDFPLHKGPKSWVRRFWNTSCWSWGEELRCSLTLLNIWELPVGVTWYRNMRIQGRKNNGTPWNEQAALKSWKLDWHRKEAFTLNVYFLVISSLFSEFGPFWVCLSFCFQINNIDVLDF